MADWACNDSLGGDRQNTADLVKSASMSVLHEPHERLDGSKPCVARPPTIPAITLEVFEKGQYEVRVDVLEGKVGRCHLEPCRCELEQELERDRVGVAGVRAGGPLDGEPPVKPSSDVRRDGRHGIGPRCHASQTSATSLMSLGVACRYQYVLATETCPR